MSEESMVEAVEGALAARGIDEQVVAAGQFNPRGHTGGLFVGGIAGGDAGSRLGEVADAVGTAAGSLAGMRAADAASGRPDTMLVGVTDATVYGFAGRSRHAVPSDLVFQVPRGPHHESAPEGERPRPGADRRGQRVNDRARRESASGDSLERRDRGAHCLTRSTV